MKLDAKTVATLALNGKSDVIYFDEEMPGFGYRLRASAKGIMLKSWIVQYRRAGASRRMLLGPASVLDPIQARAAAKKVLAKVALDEDPQAARTERRTKDRMNVRSIIDEYLAAKDVRPHTFRLLKLYLTGPYFKAIHGMPIDKVTRRDIASRLVAITREHSSVTAAKSRAVLSAFFTWAMRMGLVDVNPVIGSPQPRDAQSRDRVLSDNELAAIWRACEDDDYGKIVRLLILTGCRRAEIGGMAWSEFDGSWTLPAKRSKNGKAHTLPLPPMAMEIINEVPRQVSRDQLFGSHSSAGFTSWANGKHALEARSGVTDPPWTVHDIRRSVATGMADIGIQPHIIEQVLNHRGGHRRGPAGIYNRSTYDREVRNALALWADHIRTLAEGGERKLVNIASSPLAPLTA
jgi:integrase